MLSSTAWEINCARSLSARQLNCNELVGSRYALLSAKVDANSLSEPVKRRRVPVSWYERRNFHVGSCRDVGHGTRRITPIRLQPPTATIRRRAPPHQRHSPA